MSSPPKNHHRIAPHLEGFPYRTDGLEGTGGHVGAAPEDFLVEEIPAYEPAGEGEHCFVQIEKRGISTFVATRRLAEALSVGPRSVGHAGLKDTQAVARQWLSVTGARPQQIDGLDLPDITILRTGLHRNKLRVGHLAGNRFAIVVRQAREGAPAKALKILERLSIDGMPNIYGPQRFGKEGRNVIKGLEVISGASKIRDRNRLRFMISAVQSEMFNAYVRRRMETGTIDRVLPGDILRRGRSFFPAEDAQVEQQRVDGGEVSPTGPMFGPRTPAPPTSTEPRRIEDEVLAAYGLSREDLALFGRKGRGGRRDVLVRPGQVSIGPGGGEGEGSGDGKSGDGESGDGRGETLELRFALPPGSYATVLLREVLKVGFGQLRPLR